jgi:hypothetical protein
VDGLESLRLDVELVGVEWDVEELEAAVAIGVPPRVMMTSSPASRRAPNVT